MIRWRQRNQRLTYLLIDCISLMISFQIASGFYEEATHRILQMNVLEEIGLIVVLNICFIGLFLTAKLYDDSMMEDDFFSLRVQAKTLMAFLLAAGMCSLLVALIGVALPWLSMVFFIMSFYGFYILSKVLLLKGTDDEVHADRADRRILMVGVSPKGQRYIDEIDSVPQLGLRIVGYVDTTDSEGYHTLSRLGTILDMDAIVQKHHIDEIAVAHPLSSHPGLEAILDECQKMGLTVSMLLDCHNTTNAKVLAAMVGGVPVLKFHTVSLNENQLLIKRTLDVCGAALGIILFGISLVIFAPLIILETPGPVILKQDRVGKNGRIFKIWKYRTMGVYSRPKKSLVTVQDGSGNLSEALRLTKAGGVLQRTGIEKIPQFYNVLRGDMSLVGTEPTTVQEVAGYEHRHRKRLSTTPGLTGPWKLSGTGTRDFEELVRQDSEYIANWTLWTDLGILFRTLAAGFGPQKKSPRNHA